MSHTSSLYMLGTRPLPDIRYENMLAHSMVSQRLNLQLLLQSLNTLLAHFLALAVGAVRQGWGVRGGASGFCA